jgi:TolB-like protein
MIWRMSFLEELKRRNVIRVAIAYVVAAWLMIEISATTFPMLRLPEWSATLVTVLLMIGLPVALIFAWAFELTPEGLKKEKEVDRAESITQVTGRKLDFIIIAALAAALVFFVSTHQWGGERADDADTTEAAADEEQSVAVLAFVNMSDDPGNEYFSDGISEELLNVLVKVEGLRVASRTSSFAFKGKDTSISSIGKQLDVKHVLEGSVRKAGNTVRITAQLIDVRTDSHLWSATYDRELEDIFAIQDEISAHIVQALKVALGAGEQEAMSRAQYPTENLEAYENYLQGRYFWQRRGGDDIRRAIVLFEQATTLDPMFARAWSSMAAAHVTLPNYSDASREKHFSQAVSDAKRALSLDDSLAEAHAVLADMSRLKDKQVISAEAHYLRAIASEPKNATAHLWFSEHLNMVGRPQDGLKEALIAYRLDRLHPGTNASLAGTYWILDDDSNFMKYTAATWKLGNAGGLFMQIWAHLRIGEFDQALARAQEFDGFNGLPISVFTLYVEAMMDVARIPLFLEMLAQYEVEVSPAMSVLAYTSFGHIDDAYRVANADLDEFYSDLSWLLWVPELTTFRQDPRFAKLSTDLGLVDYWHEYGLPEACQPAGDSVICD